MNELFYQDPYCKEFVATVLSCQPTQKGFEVTLDDTAFYPEGGGQLADRGSLGAARVLDVRHNKAGTIVHLTDQSLEVGSQVKGKLDWPWRYSNMQNHTAEHIFSGLIHQRFGFDNTGFHMDADEVTVDFNGEIPPEAIDELEAEVQRAIEQNLPVAIDFPEADKLAQLDYRSKTALSGQVRIVDVPGCDRCACCGTHVKTTGEIGLFKVLSFGRHRGGTRLKIAAGLRALADYKVRSEQTNKISTLLSVKPHQTATAVEKLLEDNKARDAKLNARTAKLFALLAKDLASQPFNIVVEEDLSPQELKALAKALVEANPQKPAAALSPRAPSGFNYVIYKPDVNALELSKKLNAALHGRGGARDGWLQGSFNAELEPISVTLLKELSA